MTAFGYFKGMPYTISNENFEEYRKFKNTISREKVYEHMLLADSRDEWRTSLQTKDIFTGEKLIAGKIVDGEFVFPLDFLHYYKNYDIGIPYEYEEYLKSIGVGD